MDENGSPLKGKRAAIQFAYAVNNNSASVAASPETEEVVQKTEEQVQDDLVDVLAEIFREKAAADTDEILEKKKALLKKIGEFGHFSTTKVRQAAADEDSVDDQEEDEGASATAENGSSGPKTSRDNLNAEKKPSSGNKRSPQSLRANPLKFESGRASNDDASGIIGSEDDPFRFVRN